MPTCPNCGQDNPEGFRLCGMCGTPLEQPPALEAVRKTVTVLFSDVAGYTQAGERLDPEALRSLQSRYFDAARGALERHGATVEKFIGDAVMAVFGIPQLHEDDALRAVRAAIDLRDAVDELGLETRIGVNTGEVVAGSGDALVTGDAVNVAARLEQLSGAGEILIGELTYRLVTDAVTAEPVEPLEAKGRQNRVAAYRLLEVVPGAEGRARSHDRPLVGRSNELELLRDSFARATRDRAFHLITVLGGPGVGKSRLVEEFLTGLEEGATVARGRCLSYGDGITYWPLSEAVRQAVAPSPSSDDVRAALATAVEGEPAADRVVQLVGEAIGVEETSATTEETFWGFRKLFEALARQVPLVLVLDDIQWGEPTFLDLVEHLADLTRDASVYLICMARPELLDVRPAWAGGKLNATTFLLEPLDESETRDLLSNLVGGELPSEVAAKISVAAEGNPLFVEEMVGMLVDDGVLARSNGGWAVTGDLAAVEVPPTIRALLAARLDRLPDYERAVLERAAIEGQVFHAGAVTELVRAEAATGVGASLVSLVRREFLRPEQALLVGEEAFRFRHLLIRDAAYDALPKATRAELHERLAGWLEAKVGARAHEYAEILGYHLERAHGYRLELSPGDPRAVTLAARAGRWLAEAGRRALGRRDLPAASSLLGRAADLLPSRDPARVGLLPDLAAVLAGTGNLADARRVLEEAVEAAVEIGDERTEWRARIQRTWWEMQSGQIAPVVDTEPQIRAAIAALERLGDEYGLASAWRIVGDVHNTLGQTEEWLVSLDKAFDYARRSGNRQEEVVTLAIIGGAMFFGLTPAAEGIARLTALRNEVADDPLLEAQVLRALAGFVAMDGQLDEGRRLLAQAREVVADFGFRWLLAGISFLSGSLEMYAGDLQAAEREYGYGIETYDAMGEAGRASTLTANLADVLYRQGRLDEADELALRAAALAAEDDVATQMVVRSVRGRVLARKGSTAAGEQLVREAWEIAEPTQFLNNKAGAAEAVAEVLSLAGKKEESAVYLRRALELREQKGNRIMADRTRERLERL